MRPRSGLPAVQGSACTRRTAMATASCMDGASAAMRSRARPAIRSSGTPEVLHDLFERVEAPGLHVLLGGAQGLHRLWVGEHLDGLLPRLPLIDGHHDRDGLPLARDYDVLLLALDE